MNQEVYGETVMCTEKGKNMFYDHKTSEKIWKWLSVKEAQEGIESTLSFNDGSHLFSVEIIFSESLASLCSHAVCLPESLVENDSCLLKPDSI